MLSKVWKKIKDWSGWSVAGSIVKARAEQLFGLVTAGLAGLMAYDWMPFISDKINWVHVGFL